VANQSLASKQRAPLSKSLRMLLTTYLEELHASYLRITEDIKARRGETAWSFWLFECDIAQALDLPEYRSAITAEVKMFFTQRRIRIDDGHAGYSRHLLITVDLEKMQNLLTEQLSFSY
jgi:hypothetical protein